MDEGRLQMIDLRSRPSQVFQICNPPVFKGDRSKNSSSSNKSNSKSVDSIVNRTSKVDEVELIKLRQKKAWDLALAPAKQVPMQAFMMWMSGSGVQIFSVMMVYMLIKGAIASMISVNKTFEPYQSQATKSVRTATSLMGQKLTFIGCQMLLLLLGLWKVNGMGLLPTRLSDWIMYKHRPSWALRNPSDLFTVFVP